MSSKVKRKVTVENSSNDASDSSRRPSVFERLGPGAVNLSAQNQDRHSRNAEPGEKCRNWLRTGSCSYGSSCRYQHEAYSSNSGRQRKAEREIDEKDLRYKVRSKRKDVKETRTNVSPPPKKSNQKHAENRTSRKEQHENKLGLKSTVVITRPRSPASEGDEAPQRDPGWEDDSDDWPMDASQLDYKEELTLEMKRQQLQKELEIELQKERMMNENVTITKPVSVTGSSSSSSSSHSSSSSTSSSSGSGSVSSSSESSSSEESEGERSSSSASRSSSSSSSFHKKGTSKVATQSTAKLPKKQAKEAKHSRSFGHSRHDKSKDKSKQLQPTRVKESVRPQSATPTRHQESRSHRRRSKGAETKTFAKGERSADERSLGHKQRGPRTPSPAGPGHMKQWHGPSIGLEHQDEKRVRSKRRKRRRNQISKEPELSSKTHLSAPLQSASPNRHTGGAHRHHHRDDSSVEKHGSQKSVSKHRGGQSPGRKQLNRSPLLPPLSLPPKVAADTREHERAEHRRVTAHLHDSGLQSGPARASKKSRKGQRASPSKADSRPGSHRQQDTSRDKQSGDHSHSSDRRSVGIVSERSVSSSQQLPSGTLGRDRRKEASLPRDKEHRIESVNKVGSNNSKNTLPPEEMRWSGERGGRRIERGHKEDEERVTGQRVAKSNSNSANVLPKDQTAKRKHASPSWEKEQRDYENTEALPRYGEQKHSGRFVDDRRSERGRDKAKNDPDRESEPPNKRRANSSERQRLASHSGRESARQNSPSRSNQRVATTSTDKGDYLKNYKNESRREESERSDDNQRGVYADGGRHREQDFPLERPPVGEYGPDSYRDYRYPEAERDHYASRREYPHLRRGELEHDRYGPSYMRDEYCYQPPPSIPPEDWDHYREYSANHEPLGPLMMLPSYRMGSRGDPERPSSDRYRETDTRGDSRISSREEEIRSSSERRQRVRSPEWSSRRDERRETSPHQASVPRPQPHAQDSANWERGSRHSSRGSAEGYKGSHKKEESKQTKRDTSAPSSSSSNSSKREKEKSSSKKEPKEKSKSQREKDKCLSEKNCAEERKKRSRSKTPPSQLPPPSSSHLSRREEKKKASSSSDKSEKKKANNDEKRKKAQLPLEPPSVVTEKEHIKEENDVKTAPMSPPKVVENLSLVLPPPVPPAVSPVLLENPHSPVFQLKEIVTKEVSVNKLDIITPMDEVLQISPNDKDGEIENFSDWTDDEDDELLTRDEPAEMKGEKEGKEQGTVSTAVKTDLSLAAQESKHERRERSKDRSSKRHSRSRSRDRRGKDRLKDERPEKKESLPRIDEATDALINKMEMDDLKEKDIDYDPISDDELEALIEDPDELGKEEDNKTGLIDSLGVDWASLANETLSRTTFKPVNARKRFSTVNVLQRVGISQAWAGAELTQKVIDFCEEQMLKDSDEEDKSMDSEPVSKRKHFILEHPIAAFQVAAIEQKKARSKIMQDMGPYRKALCARQDLFIRRQLCKVGIKGTDSLSYNQQQQHVDKELYKLSVEMFRKHRSNQSAAPPVTCCS